GTEWTPATEEISPTCGSVDRQALLTEEPVSFVRMQGLDRTPIEGTKYGMSLWELQAWTGPETGAVTPEPVLDGDLLTWRGDLEPGHTVTLTYSGIVSTGGDGDIANTAGLTAPYFPDLDLQASTRHQLADSDGTGGPNGDSSTDPDGDTSSDPDGGSSTDPDGTADSPSSGTSAADGSGADADEGA